MSIRQFHLSAIAAAAGAGGGSGIYYYASAFSGYPSGRALGTVAQPRVLSCSREKIGSGPRSAIKWQFHRWGWNSGSLADTTTYTGGSIEDIQTGTVVPITVGGMSTWSITSAAAWLFDCDPILPSAFGLSSFPVGREFRVKIECTSPNADGYIGAIRSNPSSDCRVYTYNPGTTVLNGVGSAGPISVVSGADYTAISQSSVTHAAGTLIGTFAGADQDVPIIFGDSLQFGQSDIVNGNNVGGHCHRAMFGADMGSHPRASMKLCVGGTGYKFTKSNLGRWTAMAAYANVLLDNSGTNDIGTAGTGNSIATIQVDATLVWDAFRAGGLTRIYKIGMLCATSSGTLWIDAAGQTVLPGWDVGGDVETFDNWCAGGGGGKVTGFFQPTWHRDPAAPKKWKSNGAVRYSTIDGVHAQPVSYAGMGADIRGYAASILAGTAYLADDLYGVTGTVSSARLSGGAGYTESGSEGAGWNYTATSSNPGFTNNCAVSAKSIAPRENGYFEFTLGSWASGLGSFFGLATSPTPAAWTASLAGIYLPTDTLYRAMWGGSVVMPSQQRTAAAGDVIRCGRVGGTAYIEVSSDAGVTFTRLQSWSVEPNQTLYAALAFGDKAALNVRTLGAV